MFGGGGGCILDGEGQNTVNLVVSTQNSNQYTCVVTGGGLKTILEKGYHLLLWSWAY